MRAAKARQSLLQGPAFQVLADHGNPSVRAQGNSFIKIMLQADDSETQCHCFILLNPSKECVCGVRADVLE